MIKRLLAVVAVFIGFALYFPCIIELILFNRNSGYRIMCWGFDVLEND